LLWFIVVIVFVEAASLALGRWKGVAKIQHLLHLARNKGKKLSKKSAAADLSIDAGGVACAPGADLSIDAWGALVCLVVGWLGWVDDGKSYKKSIEKKIVCNLFGSSSGNEYLWAMNRPAINEGGAGARRFKRRHIEE